MEKSPINGNRRVFLVDDDVAVRRGIAALLSAAEYDAVIFSSGEAFLSELPGLDLKNAAMLVDICMPGIQGLELQERLRAEGVTLPIIVMTAHGDIPMAVRAMRNGAIDFLQKPFTADEVMSALERAIPSSHEKQRQTPSAPPDLLQRYRSLTPREDEVFFEIVHGNTNKEIARQLSISPRTVEVHRQKIMGKMQAENLAELVRMAVALNIGE